MYTQCIGLWICSWVSSVYESLTIWCAICLLEWMWQHIKFNHRELYKSKWAYPSWAVTEIVIGLIDASKSMEFIMTFSLSGTEQTQKGSCDQNAEDTLSIGRIWHSHRWKHSVTLAAKSKTPLLTFSAKSGSMGSKWASNCCPTFIMEFSYLMKFLSVFPHSMMYDWNFCIPGAAIAQDVLSNSIIGDSLSGQERCFLWKLT